MLNFDLCFVTYHSRRWLPGCLAALANAEYDLRCLHLYFADNASADGTLQQLRQLKESYGDTFGSFTILPQKQNGGFGAACNAASRAGASPFVFFYNVDTEIFPDAFMQLEKMIEQSDDSFAGFELRQFPFEHPKYYDPVTLETGWCSGACMVVRRDVLEKTGGFDETIFMYCEDVDLSWHIRALGYKLRYVPAACTWHHTYTQPDERKPMQLLGVALGDLVLRQKYGSKKQVAQWEKAVRATLEKIDSEVSLKQSLEDGLRRIKRNRRDYRNFYKSQIQNSGFAPCFADENYSFARSGGFYESHPCGAVIPITVIVRTYRRPEVLRLTLESLRWQTYPHFKVIVVEDGVQPVSQPVVQRASEWLDIAYLAANAQWGRCRACNEGVALAQTDYICFLDDDDRFFADHLETMADLIEQNPACGMLCAGSVRSYHTRAADAAFSDPLPSMQNLSREKLTALDFFKENPVPIQAVVFRRGVYRQCGGIDTALNALEDWDLWLRMVCRVSIAVTPKATSVFYVPDDPQQFAKRHLEICRYREIVYQKMEHYQAPVSAQQVFGEFWRPEHHEADILKKAIALQSSNTWRFSHRLRAIAHRWIRCLQHFAGPEDAMLPGRSAVELTMYCERLQGSFCWRLIHSLGTLPQRLKNRKP